MRLAVDTGGTFTDLVVEDGAGELTIFKSSTTPADPVAGILDVLDLAAQAAQADRGSFLADADLFIHGTTRAINAILTRTTAKTAFLATEGHPDVLLFREGGRTEPFNFTRPYPDPYVPRSLSFEIPERIGAAGEVVIALDEQAAVAEIEKLADREVEAVAVCLLWSIANPVHELRLGELLEEHLPGVPYTLSHLLNPAIREYRRASSTAIDASLKPVMSDYLTRLEEMLRSEGFAGRLLIVSSAGGVLDAAAVAEAPIHSIGSGPAMAPVAGRHYALADVGADTAVVADTGGTSYDVSLVRRGRIPWTRETWLGDPYFGHMTGFPSVDVKSIGAGGGSIAWVDAGGLLHVGPQSAGADPGPACYERGGVDATVTDASLVLGYLDPDYFLGGAMSISVAAAEKAIADSIAAPLSMSLHEAAASVLKLASEHMVRAIEEITLNQGIDPRSAVLVGGGGAAGLNVVAIARRLACPRVIVPAVAAALSAAGALMSDLTAEHAATLFTLSTSFDFDRVNATLEKLEDRCREFSEGAGAGSLETTVELSAEARYPHQIWELEVPLEVSRFSSEDDVEKLRQDFHTTHFEVFAISDPESPIEIVSWRSRVRCRLREGVPTARPGDSVNGSTRRSRQAYFSDAGLMEAAVLAFDSIEPGVPVEGPLIIESPTTTVVLDPGASAERSASGNLVITPWHEAAAPQGEETGQGAREAEPT